MASTSPRSVVLVHPRLPDLHGGNETTARRWASLLEALGWRVERAERWDGRPCDLLLALHAGHAHDSVVRFRRERPGHPIVVGAAGTDLHARDPRDADRARATFALADRIVLLQPEARAALPPELRERTRVVYQSAVAPEPRPAIDGDRFDCCYPANVRAVKDPLCAARAARRLPADSKVRVLHLGGVVDPELGRELASLTQDVRAFTSLGPLPPERALEEIARAQVVLSTSSQEGGANAISEALACHVPVLATRIPGSIGLLGTDYPGLFPVGDDRALAELLLRLERDAGFRDELETAARARSWIADPSTESESWRELLAELEGAGRRG